MEHRGALLGENDHLNRIAEVTAGTAGSRVQYPIGIRELEVLRVARLSPVMLRLTLGGEDVSGFQSHVPNEHVRLIFPDGSGELRLPERDGRLLRWPRPLAVRYRRAWSRHLLLG